jgi:hypothetical protein
VTGISDFVPSTDNFTESRTQKVVKSGINVESHFLDLKEELL